MTANHDRDDTIVPRSPRRVWLLDAFAMVSVHVIRPSPIVGSS